MVKEHETAKYNAEKYSRINRPEIRVFPWVKEQQKKTTMNNTMKCLEQ